MRRDLCRGLAIILCLGRTTVAQTRGAARVLGARAASPTVNIKGWNPAGSMRFVAWDKDSVVVRGSVARGVVFMLNGDRDRMKLGIDGDWTNDKAGPSDFTVYMPRRGTVAAKTVTADLVADGIGGWFYTVSGSIRLSGQVTSIEAETMSGNLDVNVSSPWVKAHAGDGSLLIRGAPQDVDAATIGGTLSVATSAVLRGQFSSVGGDIHFVGDPPPHAILDFSSHSGTVDLLLPQSASALLALSSISGPIENSFARVRPTSLTPQSVKISLGRGEAQVTARTFKGAIRLRAQ